MTEQRPPFCAETATPKISDARARARAIDERACHARAALARLRDHAKRRHTGRALACVTCIGLWTLWTPSSAFAQSAPTISESAMVTRRALVERAQMAARANNHEQALAFAEQAGRIEMSPSLRLFIAQERAALGRHASAMEFAELCVREASRNEALERRDMILAACRQVLSTSQRSVVLLALSLPSARRTGFALRVDGRALTDADSSVPIALDPGEHTVEATAPGVEAHRETVRGAPGAMLSITIPERFAATEPAQRPNQGTTGSNNGTTGSSRATNGTSSNNGQRTTGSVGVGSGRSTSDTSQENRERIRIERGMRPPPVAPTFVARAGAGPFVTIGVGGALLATAGVLGIVAQGALNGAGCRVSGVEIVCLTPQQAEMFRAGGPGAADPYTPTTIAQISLGVGAAALVGGTVWMIVAGTRSAPSRSERVARRVWVAPLVSDQSASLMVGGVL